MPTENILTEPVVLRLAREHAARVVQRILLVERDRPVVRGKAIRYTLSHLRRYQRPTLKSAVTLAHALDLPLTIVLARPTTALSDDVVSLRASSLPATAAEREMTGELAELLVRSVIRIRSTALGMGNPALARETGLERTWLHRLGQRSRCGLQLDRVLAVLAALNLDLLDVLTSPVWRERARELLPERPGDPLPSRPRETLNAVKRAKREREIELKEKRKAMSRNRGKGKKAPHKGRRGARKAAAEAAAAKVGETPVASV